MIIIIINYIALPKSLFSSSDWITLGGDVSEGSNELVRGRAVSAVSFSSLQPHLLLTSHPYNESDEADLRPFKVNFFFILNFLIIKFHMIEFKSNIIN